MRRRKVRSGSEADNALSPSACLLPHVIRRELPAPFGPNPTFTLIPAAWFADSRTGIPLVTAGVIRCLG
jgi:hypothetical protein